MDFLSYRLDEPLVAKRKGPLSFQQYAAMCVESYKAPQDRKELYGFKIARSDPRTLIYQDQKEAVIVFRGTDVSDVEDLLLDAALAIGGAQQSDRLQQSKELVKEIVAQVGNTNVSLTGHSLGGYMAYVIGAQYGLKSVSFNPGATPLRTQEKASLEMHGTAKKVMQWIGLGETNLTSAVEWLVGAFASEIQGSDRNILLFIQGDVISMSAQQWSGKKIIYPYRENPHSLSNFL